MKKKMICMVMLSMFLLIGLSAFSAIGTNVKTSNESWIRTTSADDSQFIWREIQKLLPSDGAVQDYFSVSVSVDGDTALIGAYQDYDGGINSGSVYVFTHSENTWLEQTKLLALDRANSDGFGKSVSLSGDTALIGADYDDDNGKNSGSVYVFTRSGSIWTQQAKLLALDGTAGDYFGHSVCLSSDTAIIGAYGDNDGRGPLSGSAYVFTRDDDGIWMQQAKLLASDGKEYDRFGDSVSINGNIALVGADWADWDYPYGSSAGSVYVFTRSGSTWTEQTKLRASDGEGGDLFGCSISLSGDTVLIGAPFDDTEKGDSSGSAYVFTRSGSSWMQQAKLLASDGAERDFFGGSVSLSGDTALIGADYDDDNGEYSGSAYVFTRSGSTWTEQAKLLPLDGAARNGFGGSVSLSGSTALIGALWDDTNGRESGSAYIFTGNINNPPDKPSVDYDINNNELIIRANDPDGDQVRYGFDWDNDQIVDKWIGFYDSGVTVKIDCEERNGAIGIIAEDEYGAQSDWVYQKSKSKALLSSPVASIIERLVGYFPILEQILKIGWV